MESVLFQPNPTWNQENKQICKDTYLLAKDLHEKIVGIMKNFIFFPRIEKTFSSFTQNLKKIYPCELKLEKTTYDEITKEIFPYIKQEKEIQDPEKLAKDINQITSKFNDLLSCETTFSFSEYLVLREYYFSLKSFISKNKQGLCQDPLFFTCMKGETEEIFEKKDVFLCMQLNNIQKAIDYLDHENMVNCFRELEVFFDYLNGIEREVLSISQSFLLLCSSDHFGCTDECEKKLAQEKQEAFLEISKKTIELQQKFSKAKTEEEKYKVSCEILQMFENSISLAFLPMKIKALKRMVQYSKEAPLHYLNIIKVLKYLMEDVLKEIQENQYLIK